MSIKTTKTITRERALVTLLSEIPLFPNDTLADLMNDLSDSEISATWSRFDNFIVSDF